MQIFTSLKQTLFGFKSKLDEQKILYEEFKIKIQKNIKKLAKTFGEINNIPIIEFLPKKLIPKLNIQTV